MFLQPEELTGRFRFLSYFISKPYMRYDPAGILQQIFFSLKQVNISLFIGHLPDILHLRTGKSGVPGAVIAGTVGCVTKMKE